MRILKYLAITIFIFFGAIASVGAFIYFQPARAYALVEKYLFPKDLKISSDRIDFTMNKNWEMNLKIPNLKIEKSKPRVEFKLSEISIQALVQPFSPHITLHNVVILSDTTSSYWSEPDPKAKPTDYQLEIHHVMMLVEKIKKYVLLENLRLEIEQFRYYTNANSSVDISAKLIEQASNDNPISLSLKISGLGPEVEKLNIAGGVNLAHFNSDKNFFDGKIDLVGKKLHLKTPLKLAYSESALRVVARPEIEYALEKNPLTLVGNLDANINKERAELSLFEQIHYIPGPLTRINDLKAHLMVPLDSDDNKAAQFKFSAPVELFFIQPKTRSAIETSCGCQLPATLAVNIDGETWLKNLTKDSADKNLMADVKIKVESIENKLFAVEFKGRVRAFRQGANWSFEPFVDAQIAVHSFHALAKALNAEHILVPAPIDSLEGIIKLDAHGPINLKYVGGKLASSDTGMSFTSDLKSAHQNVAIDAPINLTTSGDFKKINVGVKAKVHQFQIELPPINPVQGLPKTVRDSRILKTAPVTEKKPAVQVTVEFEIDTLEKGAIKLLSNLANPFVPVTVHLKQNTSTDGTIDFEAFKIEYLRRTVNVDSLRISVHGESKAGYPIVGDLHVNQTDYKVMIHLEGTTDSPHIILSSDPPLERSDIISVLLYDRTTSQLAGSDAESVGNAQAAIADRAVGLFGLWAFAGTPIKSISYNAATKVYSANIDLGKGVTAGVGTAADQGAILELRKRVSKRWVLTASWNPSDSESSGGKVVLQWEQRF